MKLLPCIKSNDEDEGHSKQIDRDIKLWIKSYNQAIKLLLLGTGESGKTTIIKQMKILHVKGFSTSERIEKIHHIKHNIHESIYDIVSNMDALGIELNNSRNEKSKLFVLKCGTNGPQEFDELYFDHVRCLWKDAGVRECFKRSNEYQLIDSAEYFLDRIDLIEKPDYVPSDADILRCRQKTSGIQKIEFKVKVFEGINVIWFVVACSDFDQSLREDHSQNRLKEALVLFEDVWQSRFLLEAGVIVFLNKQDILKNKVSSGSCIGDTFPEYNSFMKNGTADEYNRTKMFIRSLFINITKKRERNISKSAERFIIAEASRPRECYFHFTTATDTENVRTVFTDVHQMILTHILNNIGVY